MKKRIFIIFLSIFIIPVLFGVQKTAQPAKYSKIQITGYIISKGNVPFVYPVIRTSDGTEYEIICKEKTKNKLLSEQGYLIQFSGQINEDGFFVLKRWKVMK